MEEKRAKPLVSCIITTYKRDFPMLRAAVDSVCAQTYAPTEVIVVSDNDPESDCAWRVAEGMQEYPAVTYIQLPRNSGAQVARNTGILAARGEFVACLDDDDLWTPEKIEREMALFTDEDIGLTFCCGYTFSGSTENVTALYRPPNAFKEYPTFKDMLYDDYVGSTSHPLIRRAAFAKAGLFDTALKARQDYEMWIRISRFYRLRGTPERLFYHQMHEGEQITKSADVSVRSNLQVYKKYKADYLKNREAAAGLFYRVSKVCAKANHPLKAFGYRLRCFCFHPVRWAKLRLRDANPKLYHRLAGDKAP